MSYTGLCELANSRITIFPNPVIDVLTFEGLNDLNGIRAVFVSDFKGTIFKSELLKNALNVSSLSPGVYIVQIEYEFGVEKLKFMKE